MESPKSKEVMEGFPWTVSMAGTFQFTIQSFDVMENASNTLTGSLTLTP